MTLHSALLSSALLLLAFCAPAASVLYSNLGSSAAFDTSNSWTFDGGAVAGQELAVSFTTSQAVQFADAQLALGLIFTNLPLSPINVNITANSAGVPGANLANLTLASGQSVGPWPPGNLATFVCAAACPTLSAAATYWLVATIPDLNNDYLESEAAWAWNTSLNYASGADFAFNDTQFGTGWQFGDTTELRPAFEIDTTNVPTSTPEPASMALIAIGLFSALSYYHKAVRRLGLEEEKGSEGQFRGAA